MPRQASTRTRGSRRPPRRRLRVLVSVSIRLGVRARANKRRPHAPTTRTWRSSLLPPALRSSWLLRRRPLRAAVIPNRIWSVTVDQLRRQRLLHRRRRSPHALTILVITKTLIAWFIIQITWSFKRFWRRT